MPRPLTTIAVTVAAVLIVAGGASAATLDRDPLFGTAQVVLDDGSVTPLSGYADPGGDQLRVAVLAASAGPCAATAAADAGPLQSDKLVTDEYSVDVPLSGAVGPRLLCAWLERGGAAAAPPVSVPFNVVPPFAEVRLVPCQATFASFMAERSSFLARTQGGSCAGGTAPTEDDARGDERPPGAGECCLARH